MSRLSLTQLFFTLLCGLVLCAQVRADNDLFQGSAAAVEQNPALQAVVARLAQAERIRSEFRQVKTLKLLRKPLVSAGSMIFDRKLGLYWHARTPFASTLIIDAQRIVQRSGDQQTVVSARQNPVAFGFAQVFFRVLSGDVDNLSQQFELFFEEDDDGWRIGLVPKDAQLRALLANIVLSGDGDLNRIAIVDHAGDTTVIEFHARQIDGPELSERERDLYAF